MSAFALGTMTFGESTDEDGAFAQLDMFVEAGGTLVDTADVYSGGLSEMIIGKWLADRPDEMVLAPQPGLGQLDYEIDVRMHGGRWVVVDRGDLGHQIHDDCTQGGGS